MQKKHILVAVEVKYRYKISQHDFIHQRQLQRIKRSMDNFFEKYYVRLNAEQARVDGVIITPYAFPYHIKNIIIS